MSNGKYFNLSLKILLGNVILHKIYFLILFFKVPFKFINEFILIFELNFF